ncbi:hAT transposon superfamily [Trifolium repens]|nr:hAT transposon superfamily [Trifolium repens]
MSSYIYLYHSSHLPQNFSRPNPEVHDLRDVENPSPQKQLLQPFDQNRPSSQHQKAHQCHTKTDLLPYESDCPPF